MVAPTRKSEYYRKRLLNGKTMSAVAARSGVTLGGVSHILSGRRQPGLDVAFRLARAAGMDLNEWHRLYVKFIANL